MRRGDLSDLSEGQRERAVRKLMEQEAQQRFDLSAGPLFRVRLVRMSAREHLLLLTMHHIISDGWSLSVLLRELSALYRAYVRGEDAGLSEPVLQYADYALWQRNWIVPARVDRSRDSADRGLVENTGTASQRWIDKHALGI